MHRITSPPFPIGKICNKRPLFYSCPPLDPSSLPCPPVQSSQHSFVCFVVGFSHPSPLPHPLPPPSSLPVPQYSPASIRCLSCVLGFSHRQRILQTAPPLDGRPDIGSQGSGLGGQSAGVRCALTNICLIICIISADALAFERTNTVRTWTKNLRTQIQKCVLMKRNRETNDAFQKHFYHPAHQTIQRNERLLAKMRAFLTRYSRA